MTDDQSCWEWLDPFEERARAEVLFDALWISVQRTRRPDALLGRAVEHIDGDPYNHDLSNLRIVDVRENRRG